MVINFVKYHGNGNDFIMIDNRAKLLRGDEYIMFGKMCTRRFGIGADGLILIETNANYDFEMKYYNADGRPSTLCGNGGRCAIKYAEQIGLIANTTTFLATDGPHEGKILPKGIVSLKMNDVTKVVRGDGDYVIDTGSPHYIKFLKGVDDLDVFEAGRKIRYSDTFKKEGINVNFTELTDNGIKVRTYERGVEDETFSCGTGVTAAALATSIELTLDEGPVDLKIKSLGGNLNVSFNKESIERFTNIWLTGGAQMVYAGQLDTNNL